jgi:hypothetical protein
MVMVEPISPCLRSRRRIAVMQSPKLPGRSESPKYFAETAVGAVVLLSIQFLSLPLLVIGLSLVGSAQLFSQWRAARNP